MTFSLRKAERSDCPRLLELIQELAIYEKAPESVTVDSLHFEESGFGEQPVWWAWVAETQEEIDDPKIVGFALYYIRYSTWKGQQMYLEDIIVTEDMRGKGVGTLLFEKLLAVCRESGFHGMRWQVLDWNEPAIRFYEKFEGVIFDGEWLNAGIDMSGNK
jgi:GNAT superfamily N-acetyltransferase